MIFFDEAQLAGKTRERLGTISRILSCKASLRLKFQSDLVLVDAHAQQVAAQIRDHAAAVSVLFFGSICRGHNDQR